MNEKEIINKLLGKSAIPSDFSYKNYQHDFSISFISYSPLYAYVKCNRTLHNTVDKKQHSYDFLFLITYLDPNNDKFMISMPTPPNPLLFHQKCFEYSYEVKPFELTKLCEKARIECVEGIHYIMSKMKTDYQLILFNTEHLYKT